MKTKQLPAVIFATLFLSITIFTEDIPAQTKPEQKGTLLIKLPSEKSQPGGTAGLAPSSAMKSNKQHYRHTYYVVNRKDIVDSRKGIISIRPGINVLFIELVTTKITQNDEEALAVAIKAFPDPSASSVMGQISLIVNEDSTVTLEIKDGKYSSPTGFMTLDKGNQVMSKAVKTDKDLKIDRAEIVGELTSVDGNILIRK